MIHHRLNHHQSGSSSCRHDSVLASEDCHRSGTTTFLTLVAKVVPGTSPVQHALGAAKPFFFFADLGFCATKQSDAFAGSRPAPVIDSVE